MSLFILLQSALTPGGVVGLFALVAFIAVYVIRKKFGPQWERLAAYIPALNFDLTPGYAILSKFAQALPGILVAAVLGAITSGGSLGPTLLAALGGALAAVGHEFAKWLPFIPYRGETGDVKIPGAPKLPTGLSVLMLACFLSVGCAGTVAKDPCTAADKAAIEAQYSAKFLFKCANFESAAECPYTEDLRAERAKAEEKCR